MMRDVVAPNAVAALIKAVGPINHTDGTLADTVRMQREELGTSRFVLYNIPTAPHQQRRANDFVLAANGGDNGHIISFGSLHPKAEDAMEELHRLIDAGLKGIKFHPEYQQFYVDDPKMEKIYKKISELNLITVFHAGYDPGFGPESRCLPHNFKKALKHFESPVVLAHWGGVACWIDVLSELCGLNVYFDTSMGYLSLPRPVAIKMLEKHGVDRFLFASDSPWHKPELELCYLSTLCLSENEHKKIYSENALKLIKD